MDQSAEEKQRSGTPALLLPLSAVTEYGRPLVTPLGLLPA